MHKTPSIYESQWLRLMLASLVLSLFTSCTPIIKSIYGIKQPKFSSDGKITNFTYSLQNEISPQLDSSRPKFVVVFASYLGRLKKINTKPCIDRLASRNDNELFFLNIDIAVKNGNNQHADVQ